MRLPTSTQSQAPPARERIERALRASGFVLFIVLGVRAGWMAYRGRYDFDGFHRAAAHILEHGRILDEDMVARYLPHFQVMHLPFALLPVTIAGVVWYLLSVAALLATPREVERLSGIAPREQWPAWLVVAPIAIDNLNLGQSGLVLLWAALCATNRAREGQGLVAGGALGLAGLFKVPTFAMAAPALLLGPSLRVLAGVALAFALATGLLVASVGPQDARESTLRWVETIRTRQSPQGMVERSRSLRYNNQSLPITLARTFGDIGDASARGAVRLAQRPLREIWALSSAVVAGLALLGIACVVRGWRRGRDRESWLVVTALAALGMLFTSPLVWTHYFVWALPSLVALRAPPRALVAAACASLLLLAVPAARALGAHLALSIALFVALAVRFLRSPLPVRPAGARQ